MSVVVVVLLVVLWAWILLPGAVRERRQTSPASTISRFERSMAQLARARPVKAVRSLPGNKASDAGVWVLDDPEVPGSGEVAARAARRRRQVLTSLTAATTVTLIAAQVLGGASWFLFWFTAILLVTYLGLLAHRWVRISQDAALPLVRPPARQPFTAADDVDAGAGTQIREVPEYKVDHKPVSAAEW